MNPWREQNEPSRFVKQVLFSRIALEPVDEELPLEPNGMVSINDVEEDLLSRVEGEGSSNPFSRVRAEQFKDDKLLARAFAEPMSSVYSLVKSLSPTVILGGRGSGKTTILKSMTPEILLIRYNKNSLRELKAQGINYFGFYFKLESGSLSIHDNDTITSVILRNNPDSYTSQNYSKIFEQVERREFLDPMIRGGVLRCRHISLQEMNLKILKAIIEYLQSVNDQGQRFMSISRSEESRVVEEILSLFGIFDDSPKNFGTLLRVIDAELSKISRYLQEVVFSYLNKQEASWVPTTADFLDTAIGKLVHKIEELDGIQFYLLFDEFENLMWFQQEIINEWVKTSSNFTVKVASKNNGIYSSDTIERQSLQQGHDIHTVQLDYDLTDVRDFSEYKDLLKRLSTNLLRIAGYRCTDIQYILSDPDFIEVPEEQIRAEIKHIRQTRRLKFSEDNFKKYKEKLEIAAVFRILRKEKRLKTYHGLSIFAYLSSGIIRAFLNLAGMAINFAEESKLNMSRDFHIPAETQSRAAFIVSKVWLERVPKQYNFGRNGSKMYELILDIGEILRRKLLKDPNEPETLAISIRNPDLLEDPSFSDLRHLLDKAVRESLLMERIESDTPLPKDPLKNKTRDFSLNRIYAPVLRLSYRTRWRGFKLRTEEFARLIDHSERDRTKLMLLNRAPGRGIEDDSSLDDFGGD